MPTPTVAPKMMEMQRATVNSYFCVSELWRRGENLDLRHTG